MNINFLPSKIKEDLKQFLSGKIPFSAARASGSIERETGEGYIVALDDKALLFSRKTGEDAFLKIEIGEKELASVKLRKEGFNLFLDVNICEKPYSIKFSSLEENDLKTIVNKFSFHGKDEDASSAADIRPAPFTTNEAREKEEKIKDEEPWISERGQKPEPMAILAAALMFVSKIDNTINKEEDFYIVSLLEHNKEFLQKGLSYFKTNTFDGIIEDSKRLSNIQQLCILSNMIELAMRDGSFSGIEQKMINKYVSELGIDLSQYETIKEVLLIKNRISAMT
jgi:uncharacterized tellurite resistance protein B-like protein